MTNGSVHNGPPASTLAAQLVENISTTAKSTRPDETQEIKRLLGIIERVKNNPDLLTTPEEQVEHNHMLIYVYARVVLDSIKLDDPFVDRVALKTSALKAINFIRVTVKETPGVLGYTTDGTAFLFRGTEPLWLWILPRLLRMLGHAQCANLTAEISDFCRFLLLPQNANRATSAFAMPVVRYLQGLMKGKAPAGRFGVANILEPLSILFVISLPQIAISPSMSAYRPRPLWKSSQLCRSTLSKVIPSKSTGFRMPSSLPRRSFTP